MKKAEPIESRSLAVKAAATYQRELRGMRYWLDTMIARMAHKLERARTQGLDEMAASALERLTWFQQAGKAVDRELGESEIFVGQMLESQKLGDRKN